MNLKFISKNKDKEIFEIDQFSSVSDGLVKDLMSQHKSKHLVFVPRNENFKDLDQLREQVSDRYFVQLGFTARPEEIQQVSSEVNDHIKPVDIKPEELLDFMLSTYRESFEGKWRQYLGEELNHQNMQFLKEHIRKEKSLVLFDQKKEKNIAMLMTFPSEYCLGEPLEQIGWVWTDQSLNEVDKKNVQALIASWLKNQKNNLYQAGVHIHNISSLKYFNKLGFRATCVHIIEK